MKVPVSKLKPHPLNEQIYCLSNIDDLVASIKEVGLLVPLTINGSMQVVSGHRRLAAIKELGWQKVEVEKVATKNEHEEITLLIAHNKQRVKTPIELLAEANAIEPTLRIGQGKRSDLTSADTRRSGRTDELVADAIGISRDKFYKLKKIASLDKSYLELVGQERLSLNQAYTHLKYQEKEQEHQDAVSAQPFNNPDYTFYNKSSQRMTEVETESVQTIITSPPYFRIRTFAGSLGNEKTTQEYVTNLVEHLKDCWRVLKPSGSFFLNLGDTNIDGNLQNVPHKVVIALQDQGWLLRNQIVWRKLNPKPKSSKKGFTNSYEFIFHLTKSMQHDFYPTNIPAKNKHKPGHIVRQPYQRGKKAPYPMFLKDTKNMGNYWDGDIVETAVVRNQDKSAKDHPATFAEQVVMLPIMQTSRKGDLILDPFSGTGTTGKVANELGRKFVGYDIVVY